MTKREQEQWATFLKNRGDQAYGPGEKIVMPGKIPNKANSYQIRIDPNLYRIIKPIVEDWKKKNTTKRAWWIGPSEEVQNFEQALAYLVTGRWKPKDDLSISIELHGSKLDMDGVKAILDGVQASGRVPNDRQFSLLQVERFEAPQPRAEIDIQLRRREP